MTVDPFTGSLLVDQGVVYVPTATSSGNNVLYALRAHDGTLLWHQQIADTVRLLTAADGAVYVTFTASTALVVLRASDGTLLWQHAARREIAGVIVSHGVVYISEGLACTTNPPGALYALHANDGSPCGKPR